MKLIVTNHQDQMVITQNSAVKLPAPNQSVVPAAESRLDTRAQETTNVRRVSKGAWEGSRELWASEADICASYTERNGVALVLADK